MGRGILTGLIWGVIVVLGIMTVANQLVDIVAISTVDDGASVLSDDTEVESVTLAEDAEEVAQAVEEAVEEAPQEASDDTSEPARDEAAQVTESAPETEMAAPQESAVTPAPATEPTSDATVDAAPAVQATPTPLPTEPTAMDAAPAVRAEADTFEAPVALDDGARAPAPTAPDTDLPQTDAAPVAQTVPSAPATLQTPKDATLTPPVTAPETPVLGGLQGKDLSTPDADTPPAVVETDPPAAASLLKPTGRLGQSDSATDDGSKSPTIGHKVGSFTDRKDPLKSNRLPSIGGTSAQTEAAPVIEAEDLPALVAHSADYTPTGSGAKMSVILVDIGAIEPDAALLANLPFAVTFAVDALAPGAAERALMYRTAGLEVLSLIGLPEGATAQDAALTINQARDLVPVAVGFLDIPSASFQASREIAAQVVASARSSGHGVVSFSRGLNALMQEAVRAKQPAALVFRDFDGRGQDASAMKRFLDQAAFRAGIDEDIVLVGRAQQSTLAALAEWSLGNRAATVEMVPLSYLLREAQTASGSDMGQPSVGK